MRRAASISGMGVGLVVIAFMFDSAPLFVPGVSFVLLGVLASVWVALSARGAGVERRLDRDRVLEGEPLEARLEVRRGRLGLPGGEVVDPLLDRPLAVARQLSLLGGARTATVSVVTRFERRGLRELKAPSLVVADRLGLARLVSSSSAPTRHLLVLPRTEPIRWTEVRASGPSQHADGRASVEPQGAVDVDGLRPYRPGAPASRIHWPALARGAGLLERRLQADGETRPLIVLDARGDVRDEHLDAAVRAAASLTLELARLGGCALLLGGERRASTIEHDLSGWSAAHARLALVEGGPTAPAPIFRAGVRTGALFYVTAAAAERVPAGLLGAGGGARVLVAPKACCERASGPASFEVAGCYGFVLRAGSGFSYRRERVA